MRETRKKYDMLTDNPGKALLFFVLPMIFGNLFQQFYNITDSVVVGKFVGEQALAAVGASYAITNVFIAIAIGGGIGSSVVISQFLGAGKLAKMKTAVYTTMFNFLGIAAFLAAVGILFNNQILSLVNVPEDIFSDAALYLAIYFIGLPFLFMYNVQASIFNALGFEETAVSSDFLFAVKYRAGYDPGDRFQTGRPGRRTGDIDRPGNLGGDLVPALNAEVKGVSC